MLQPAEGRTRQEESIVTESHSGSQNEPESGVVDSRNRHAKFHPGLHRVPNGKSQHSFSIFGSIPGGRSYKATEVVVVAHDLATLQDFASHESETGPEFVVTLPLRPPNLEVQFRRCLLLQWSGRIVSGDLRNPDRLPVEFRALGILPEPWTPEVVISRHQGLLGNINEELSVGRAVASLGPEKVAALMWFELRNAG